MTQEATNGGAWETHYTEAQRELWRDRVQAAMRMISPLSSAAKTR
jgi:hypothetical protein